MMVVAGYFQAPWPALSQRGNSRLASNVDPVAETEYGGSVSAADRISSYVNNLVL
jgi:hypothetical protein